MTAEPARSIEKLGFKRWYERQLIESHAWLVSCILCSLAICAVLELVGFRRVTSAASEICSPSSVSEVLIVPLGAVGSSWPLKTTSTSCNVRPAATIFSAVAALSILRLERGPESVPVRLNRPSTVLLKAASDGISAASVAVSSLPTSVPSTLAETICEPSWMPLKARSSGVPVNLPESTIVLPALIASWGGKSADDVTKLLKARSRAVVSRP